MWDFSFARAVGMVMRTLPFVVLRLLVYAGISISYLFAIGSGAGIGWLIGRVASVEGAAGGAFWGALVGFWPTTAILYLLREYLLYMVKAAHIAVLVEIAGRQDCARWPEPAQLWRRNREGEFGGKARCCSASIN